MWIIQPYSPQTIDKCKYLDLIALFNVGFTQKPRVFF